MRGVGVVLHPSRPVAGALAALEDWTGAHGLDLTHIDTGNPAGAFGADDASACELVVAVGGDGTVLAALHAAAANRTPVVGVACGSLGALTALPEAELRGGLDRIAAGEWRQERVPALCVDAAEGQSVWAINDLVLVRRGGTQLIVELSVAGDLYARIAGDGVVVATPLGSSAYSMAAGGPVLASGTETFVCTPLAMHGGCAPPVVVPADSQVLLEVDPGYGGFDLEIDGRRVDSAASRFPVRLVRDYATLVAFADPNSGLPGLRGRGLITDSPRVLARDAREARSHANRPPR
jgi:NAD+ kinase